MPFSMTGYACVKRTIRGTDVEIELKSVNGKAIEVKVHGSRDLGEFEIRAIQKVRGAFERGTFRVGLSLRGASGSGTRFNLDLDLLRSYKNAHEFVAKELGLSLDLTVRDILSLPNAIEFQRAEEAIVWADIEPLLEEAIAELRKSRAQEGAALVKDVKSRLKVVERCVKTVVARDKNRLKEKSARLRDRIAELAGGAIDADRIAQEVALLCERLDVSEEVTRLGIHVKEMRDLLGAEGPVGKALDFRSQEMLRELNTIASKANDVEFSNATIEARGEVEKIREQVQNLE